MERKALETQIETGATQRQIAERLGVSRTKLRAWLYLYGLRTKRTPPGRAQKAPYSNRGPIKLKWLKLRQYQKGAAKRPPTEAEVLRLLKDFKSFTFTEDNIDKLFYEYHLKGVFKIDELRALIFIRYAWVIDSYSALVGITIKLSSTSHKRTPEHIDNFYKEYGLKHGYTFVT